MGLLDPKSGGFIGHDSRTTRLNFNYLVERLPSSAGGLRTARITARALDENGLHIYSGVTVTREGGEWVDADDGDDLNWNLNNLYSDPSGNPVAIGDRVGYWQEGDEYAFERSSFKGTYP